MEELVEQLSDIELAVNVKIASMGRATKGADQRITEAEHTLEVLKEHRAGVAAPFVIAIAEDERRIEALKAQIIEAWDGEKKTLATDAGTLKFRTTQSLKIEDGAALLAKLIDTFSTNKIADEYLTGFNKTAVKKFMTVIPLPPDVVELISKTTVKLEAAD